VLEVPQLIKLTRKISDPIVTYIQKFQFQTVAENTWNELELIVRCIQFFQQSQISYLLRNASQTIRVNSENPQSFELFDRLRYSSELIERHDK
jgi:hypothetical protein